MILYGSNLSPYTRRVVIWCALQGRAIERRELRVAGAAMEEIATVNPVIRVPALVLDDGTALIESFAICDWLEETATPERRLIPGSGAARRDCMQRIALAHSLTEKAVAVVYEFNRRPEALRWQEWIDRLTRQVRGGLEALDRAVIEEGFHGGARPDGGDIAAAIAQHFIESTNPWLLDPGYPRLRALGERARALEPFASTMPGA